MLISKIVSESLSRTVPKGIRIEAMRFKVSADDYEVEFCGASWSLTSTQRLQTTIEIVEDMKTSLYKSSVGTGALVDFPTHSKVAPRTSREYIVYIDSSRFASDTTLQLRFGMTYYKENGQAVTLPAITGNTLTIQ